ncbi:fasciclin domain-containing protein [Niabella beijingensis]|uniref:fasciclin domain-containing protein n=1 Tax=Niabella beijingensis TaxID=2872700 RepID=UPI001CBC9382|nr:fasciclin domain-containing protein [Niabella beijingensis]MBZ4192454.1 fasciclin domain-containing protein [Niabella beijingensis]
MKMYKELLTLWCSWFLSGLLLVSCTKELNEYYNPKSALDKNIIEVLEADGRFSLFVSMIDKVKLRKTLGNSAIYTCLAPVDEQVQLYLSKLGYNTVDQVPEALLRKYVNYHFINGMYYEYDINKIYNAAASPISKSRAANFTTRTEGNTPGKHIQLFSSSFFNSQLSDYLSLYPSGKGEASFVAEGVVISEPDIDASNGVIHVLGAPLEVTLRADEALAADSETTIFSSWLEKHVQYVLGEKDEFGWVDTTLYKSYSVGRNLADEATVTTLLVPTNEAIRTYFEPYMGAIDNTLDSIPKPVMYSLIRAAIVDNIWYQSDLKRMNPDWRTLAGYTRMTADVPSLISGSVRASNSVIYKVNKLLLSPEMHSVMGGILLKYKKFSQWYWMVSNAGVNEGLYDILYYQHSPKTMLIQSDEVWGIPLAEDLNQTDLELKKQQCKAGIFNIDVRADGGFRRRFYPTGYGYVYYENGRFYDYTGHSVGLSSSVPEWEGANGAIYQIDGFLKPIDKISDTLTVYSVMKKQPDLSLFTTALDRSGIASQLQLTGFFSYTVLAPTNQAITTAGIDVAGMSTDAARTFVQSYVIPNRYVFTDGEFNGQIADKNNAMLQISGAWQTFTVRNGAGKTITPAVANIQGNNGVIHKVNSVF